MSLSLSLSVCLYLSRLGCNRGSLTSGPRARHDGSPAWRLLTSVCVLFNNSLNHPPTTTPSLLRNVTQPLTEVTQAPPLSHPSFTERERDRKQDQVWALRQLSHISRPSSLLTVYFSFSFRFAPRPAACGIINDAIEPRKDSDQQGPFLNAWVAVLWKAGK